MFLCDQNCLLPTTMLLIFLNAAIILVDQNLHGLLCRLGNDKGRSVSAWGFWGDILNSPFHSFGTASKERSFFKISNKQFTHTSIAVAEYNVMVCPTLPARACLTCLSLLHKHHVCSFGRGAHVPADQPLEK